MRRILEDTPDDRSPARLRRVGAGYLLEIDPDQVDLHRARRLAAAGRAIAPGDPDRDRRAVALLRDAYAGWQGSALAGVTGDWADRVRRGLEQERIALAVDLFRAELRVGEHAAVLGQIAALLADHPLSESLVALHMLALYRCGRAAEALDLYTQTRKRFVEALGDEPGVELRRMQEQILHRDPALVEDPAAGADDQAVPAAPTAPDAPAPPQAAAVSWPPPAELPADVAAFAGRAGELATLDRLLPEPPAGAPLTPVVAIDGPAGVGKTALAVHWAHRVRAHFPDGQLYVDLRGYARGEPAPPALALAHLLLALGVPAGQVPAEVTAAAAMYRSLLVDKRVLILLDNAMDPDQIRPLLPAGDGTRVLVTSRTQLVGLVAREGATRVRLDVLPEGDARTLVSAHLDGECGAVAPEELSELVDLCGRLPLAMRIAAANAVAHPQRGLRDLLDRLRDRDRLSALAVPGDPSSSVAGAFALSYDRLPAAARRLFRLIGLVPMPALPVAAVANLAGTSPAEARRTLEVLGAASLVEERTAGRYGCHDLLWRYAADLLDREPPGVRDAARDRLYGYYLEAADSAADVAYPHGLRMARRSPRAVPAPAPRPADPPEAMRWLESERANLVAAVGWAAECGWHYWATSLADSLRGYFWLRMHAAEWESVAAAGLAAAEAAGDLRARAAAHLSLGNLYGMQGQREPATRHTTRALALARRVGWIAGAAVMRGNLGLLHAGQGDMSGATDQLLGALAGCREAGSRHSEAAVLTNLGSVYVEMGELRSATRYVHRALALDTTLGLAGRATCRSNLGALHYLAGDLERARRELTEARRLSSAIDSCRGLSVSQRWLALVALATGQVGAAEELAVAALALARDDGYQRYAAAAGVVLATVHLRRGLPQRALTGYREALGLAGPEQSATHSGAVSRIGIASAQLALGRPEQAREQAERARAAARAAPFRILEAEAHTVLAECHLATGSLDRAAYHGEEACRLHRGRGYRLGEVRARVVRGRVARAAGDATAARHWWRAHTLLTAIGAPRAEAVPVLLAA